METFRVLIRSKPDNYSEQAKATESLKPLSPKANDIYFPYLVV